MLKPGYLTYGRFVFLGKVSKRIRANAKRAGLKIIPAREMGKMIRNDSAFGRIVREGVWHDTVKY